MDMKKLLIAFSLVGLFQMGIANANVPGPCKDKSGNTVPCKNSTSKNDSKSEKDVKKAADKTVQGGKHAGYDASHNKATKKLNVNEGNQKYKYKDDVK